MLFGRGKLNVSIEEEKQLYTVGEPQQAELWQTSWKMPTLEDAAFRNFQIMDKLWSIVLTLPSISWTTIIQSSHSGSAMDPKHHFFTDCLQYFLYSSYMYERKKRSLNNSLTIDQCQSRQDLQDSKKAEFF